MKGTLLERSPRRWRLRVYLGVDSNGKQRFLTETYRGGKRGAERRLAALVTQATEGRVGAADKRLTLSNYLDKWQAKRRIEVSEHSVLTQQRIIDKHINPGIGHLKLSKIIVADIEELYADMVTSGLSASTVRGAHAVLRTALRDASRTGLLMRNPAADAKTPKGRKKQVHVLSDIDLADTLEAMKGHWLELPLLLALATGLRRGELLGLHWDDIDFNKGEIIVQHNLQDINNQRVILDVKTESSRRRISLPSSILDRLHQWRRDQRKQQLATGVRPALDLIFYDRHGKPRSVKSFSHMVKKLGDSIGVRLTPHIFRHQHASQLLRSSVPIKAVQMRLGHASAQTTLDVYGHLIPDDDPALAVVESWMDGML
ncbi:MAG: site-specific integrase [Candidatus Thiodiazotropha sp. (ex Codakia rugifera)]|nr:site-specific integrase [Candidatus Thiodiazotropha sp. (ex Codakia rugifera)]